MWQSIAACKSQYSLYTWPVTEARKVPESNRRWKQFCVFSRKSLRYTAFGMGLLTAVPYRSTKASTLRGTVKPDWVLT